MRPALLFRLACLGLLAALLCIAASARAIAQRESYWQPQLKLTDVLEREQQIPAQADWHKQRVFEGTGWKLATSSRQGRTVMRGALTIITPEHAKPVNWQNLYVLAAFELAQRQRLLVVVRDPEYYWPGYDWKLGLIDPLELVWYDKDWQECRSVVLDYAAGEYPDDFVMSPDQLHLLAIRHPLDEQGEPVAEGHSLNVIYLSDGSLNDVQLPEADELGQPPLDWQPLRMGWTQYGALMVQAGAQVRVYEVGW